MLDIIPKELEEHFYSISKILKDIGERVEGNLICDIEGDNFTFIQNESKIYNLLELSKNKDKICEIGFNAGHSLLLMIFINPTAKYLIFDLGNHDYTKPCLNYIKSLFPNTEIEIIYGDSKETLKEWVENNKEQNNTFNLIHIDGGHDTPTVENDFIWSKKLGNKECVYIFDDYNYGNIKDKIDSYKNLGIIQSYKENLKETNLHYIYKTND